MKLGEKVVRKLFETLSQCWKDHPLTMAKFKYSWFVGYMEINKCNSAHQWSQGHITTSKNHAGVLTIHRFQNRLES